MTMGLQICRYLALSLTLLLPVSATAQQEAQVSAAETPVSVLKPANTSSPRDTLRSFLDNMEATYRGLSGENSADILITRRRALQTMNLADADASYDWVEQGARAVYLKEILDRTPLPAWEDIPDAQQIRESGIRQWTIPDTNIVIARVDGGARDGEFLFSGDTITELHLTYRLVKDTPYLPGATEGFHELIRNFYSGETDAVEDFRSRLQPIDSSNPRALFEEFLVNMNAAYRLTMEADARMKSPEGLTLAAAQGIEREAQALIGEAIATLDLGKVPRARQHDVGVETVLQLKEVFDRARLPAIASIPGSSGVAAMREAQGVARWQFPDTNITIAEVQEGPYAGSFRFTADTVDGAPDLFTSVRDLPYRHAPKAGVLRGILEAQYIDADTSPGFYDYYESTPGSLVPAASWVWPLVKQLPDGLYKRYLGQTVWQWIGIALALLVLVTGFVLLNGLGELVNHYLRELGASWVKILLPLLSASLVYSTGIFIDDTLNTTGVVSAVVNTLSAALITLFMAAAALRLAVAFAEAIVALPRFADREFDASLVRVTARILGFFVAVVIAVSGFSQLGLEIMPLIAGLGVGGLAVALAVRPTLENMIGGLIIYADKPVKVGDFCTFGNHKGVVEGIGLRSTRIRGLDRTVITVPNSVFADMEIVNFARCDTLLISTVIGVRYETSVEQLRNIMAKMRRVCFAHPRIETDTLRVRFGGFGASSLNIDVRVYALTNEWNEFFAIKEDLFLRFIDVIEECGSSVAFPSTTVYMGEDGGLNEERKLTAEQEVAQWRENDELPFPTTPEYLAAEIIDTLDYPPKGSPLAAGKRAAESTEEKLDSGEEDSSR